MTSDEWKQLISFLMMRMALAEAAKEFVVVYSQRYAEPAMNDPMYDPMTVSKLQLIRNGGRE